MDRRISRALAAGVAVTLPLLAGCGGGADSGSAAPAQSSAPASSQPAAPSTGASAPSTPASTPAATSEPSSGPSPSVDPATSKEDVAKAAGRFVTAVLTIGYPDKSYTDDYLPRLEPLMTRSGFASVRTTRTEKQGTEALKTLYSQRSRSSPDLQGDAKVSDLTSDSATARVTYVNRAQVKQGGGWKTLKNIGKDTVTVKLVKDGGKWLVDDAR